MKFYLHDCGVLSAAGNNGPQLLSRLLAGDRSGLIRTNQYSPGHTVYVGQVQAELPPIPAKYSLYDCRNNQLLLAAADQIGGTITAMKKKFGADRIGVVLGTSTSGVRNTELALTMVNHHQQKPPQFHYKQQQLAAGADFLANILDLKGPAYAISTACSSSGKAFASARRLLSLDLCDAVIVGGADSLCRYIVTGFDALKSVSAGLCKPFGRHRDGINLAEASALLILSKHPGPVQLQGIGASSDAWHFSAPDPKGRAVIVAMEKALQEAQLSAAEIDYINLHGTATPLNDEMESQAVHHLFGEKTPLSSTKGMTGHALGAAAALELSLCWLLLNRADELGSLPPNINDDQLDNRLPQLNFVLPGQQLGRRIKHCQSQSFAFGGNNISIIISRV